MPNVRHYDFCVCRQMLGLRHKTQQGYTMKKRANILILQSGGPSDTTRPTVAITSSESSPSFSNPIPLTFTLSEASVNFAVGDITVGAGGSIGNFAGSGTSYTADLTVTTAQATITVDVAEGAFTDAAGNTNTAATQFSITSALALVDKFTTADAAPLTTPRSAEPGPGTFTVTDTGNKYDIATAKLTPNAAAAGSNDPMLVSGNIVRAAGMTFFANLARTVFATTDWRSYFGFGGVVAGGPVGSLGSSSSNTKMLAGAAVGTNIDNVTDTFYDFFVVLRSTGWLLIRGTTLAYVDFASTTTPLAAGFWGGGSNRALPTVDKVCVGQLGAPWSDDWGIVTNRVAIPGVGETTTQVANAIVEMTWTAVTGQTWNLMVRRTDDSNCWMIRSDQTGSTIKIIQVQAGVETERASAAQTFTNGTPYRVHVICEGNVIKTSIGTADKAEYQSASFNNPATGVKTDRAGTNLVAWPRTISGAALTELAKIANP
jgi:hypothetical protein